MSKRIQRGHKGGRAWRRRLACERAIALPTAAMMLMIIMLLAAAAGTAAIGATGQSNRDTGTKRAVAAADAGLDTAIYRLNKLKPSALSCVVNGPLYLLLDPVLGTGWCPVVTSQLAGGSQGGEELGDGSSFTYEMSAGQSLVVNGQNVQQRKIIATGSANGVSRRVMATVSSLTGISLFGGNALTSLNDISLPAGTTITGGVASNGNIGVALCPQIVGNSWYGPGKAFTIGGNPAPPPGCPLFTERPLPQNLILNPVNEAAQLSNNNANINSGGGDPFTLRFLSTWNPGTRVLQLKTGSTLTLTGNVYSFCKLEVDSLAQLIIAPRFTDQPVKIYIDSPEHCGGMTNPGTMKVSGTGVITNLNATSDTLQISALGSPASGDPPSVQLLGTVPSNLIATVYAPRSEVKLTGANAILGAVAAEQITLQNLARIQWLPSADITVDNLAPLFKRTSWTECKSKPIGSEPDSGC